MVPSEYISELRVSQLLKKVLQSETRKEGREEGGGDLYLSRVFSEGVTDGVMVLCVWASVWR